MFEKLLFLVAILTAGVAQAGFSEFPSAKGISLTQTEGHWHGFGNSSYDTREFVAAGKWSTILADHSTLECEFSFDTLLPDVESVLIPETGTWPQVQ